jgi:hypothetical protein
LAWTLVRRLVWGRCERLEDGNRHYLRSEWDLPVRLPM